MFTYPRAASGARWGLCLWLIAAPVLASAGEMDTHMSATYALARQAGLGKEEASLVARANWSMDLNNVTIATPDAHTEGNTLPDGNVPSGSRVKRGASYHALGPDGETVRTQVETLRAAIAVQARVSREAELRAVGQYLHALQDVYFHQTLGKPDGKWFGHAHENHASDRVGIHYDAALRAFEATAETLRVVAENKGRAVKDRKPEPPVQSAAELYGRDPTTGLMVSKKDLERMASADKGANATGVMRFASAIVLAYGKEGTVITGDPGEPDLTKVNEGLERAWKGLGHDEPLEPLPRIDWHSRLKLDYDQHPDLVAVPLQAATNAAPPVGGITLSQAVAVGMAVELDLDSIRIEDGAVVLSGPARSGATASRFDVPLFLTTLRLACEREDASFSLDAADGAAWISEATTAMIDARTALAPRLAERFSRPSAEEIESAVSSEGQFIDGPWVESDSIRSLDPRLWDDLRARHPHLGSRLVFHPDWLRQTRVGRILFEADLLLKELSSGFSLTQAGEAAAVSRVDGFVSSEEDRVARMTIDLLEGRTPGDSAAVRLWFELPRPAATNLLTIPALPPGLFISPEGFLRGADSTGGAIGAVRSRLTDEGYLASVTSSTRAATVSSDDGTLDLSEVWPNLFIRIHDLSTGEDLAGSEPSLDALADRVNGNVAAYADVSPVLGSLVSVLRAYVASVQITRTQPALCAELAALPFFEEELVSEPLPAQVPGDLVVTVLRLDRYTAAGQESNLFPASTLQGGISMAGKATTVVHEPTALTRLVKRESAGWRSQPPQWTSGDRGFVALPIDLAEAAAEAAAIDAAPLATRADIEALMSGHALPSRATAGGKSTLLLRLVASRWSSLGITLVLLGGGWACAMALVTRATREKKKEGGS